MRARNPAVYVFALICLAMAGVNLFHELDGKFIGLVLLAVAPWLAPELVPFLKTLKFGGMELTFRDLEKRMKQNERITAAAGAGTAGKAPARPRARVASAAPGGVRHYDVLAPALETADGASIVSVDDDEASDPNKGAFGGERERDGYRLAAEVTAVPQSTELFLIHAWVEASAGQRPLRDGANVVFHLHPTFNPPTAIVAASGGTAALDRLAWGAFTIGVEVEGVRLELDLATDVPGAPALFRSR